MKCSFVVILAVSICFLGTTKSCPGLNENWKLLDGLPWNVTTRNGTRLYQISLCRPLKYDSWPGKNCNGSAVCIFENGTARSLADFSTVNGSMMQLSDFYLIDLKGLPCPGTADSQEVSILFRCDEHLNSPKLIIEDECTAHFMWITSAVCTGTPRKEVPCYAYDKDGRIKNLTPLIKKKGGYAVSSTDFAVDFFINVCSDIIPENETRGCPQGASACRKIGSEFLSFGSPDTALFSSDSDLKIVYNSINTQIPAGCDMPPSTTIAFKCPPKGRGHSPRVISNSNCQYEIEWETEYSCPLDTLMTDMKTCKFTREQHGVELDLSPLKKHAGGYRIIQTAGNKNTSFLLNVCGGLDERNGVCGKWKSNSVCMNDSSGGQMVIGTTKGASLRYSDGDVKLIYTSNNKCTSKDSTSFKTVIEFQCEPNAENNGLGQPQFVEEEDCVYLFNWKTKHACPKYPLSNSCYINADNIHIDLGILIKNSDEKPWQVINALESNNNKDTYYLNVCGSISRNFDGSSCEAGTALCKTNSSGNSISYGMFTSSPTYNKQFKTVHMTYTEGDSCGSGQRETHISFFCKPGVLDSPPILERISDDGCHMMIRWHTAAACPQAMRKGSDCKVIDDDLGLVFDLNPLRKDTYYEVKGNNCTYYLNVCDKVNGTLCDKTRGNSQNAAACQENEGTTIPIKLGEPNSELLYIDGMINLTYTLGTPYNNGKKVPRTTSITFLCNEAAGMGYPEFLEEAHHAYSFRWYTSYACPANVAIECLVRDPLTNEQYDLSRLTKAEGEQNWMVSSVDGNKTKRFYLNTCRPLIFSGTQCSYHSSACLIEADRSKGSQVVRNIGQMLQPPTIKSSGHIELVYTNGDPCIFYGINTTYNTTLHFICEKTDKGHPMYIGNEGNCQHTFLWATSAACPVEEAKSENDCSLKDPLTGIIYNFAHLKTKYYNVTAGARRFQVNICGAVSGGCQDSNIADVTACEIDEKGNLKKIIGILTGYSLTMSEDELMTLKYDGIYNQSLGAVSKVYITFKCNKLGQDNNLTFKEELDFAEYYFELSSPMVCFSEWSGCTFSDDLGNNYDLTPLKRNGSNWEVADNSPGHSDLRYHINFCMPVNPTESYKCPVGAIGACQTSTRNNMKEGFSLGVFGQRPIIQDKTIIISYTGGTPCHDGQYNRSTEIILYCSKLQLDPVFIGETPRCEYYFSMNTPAACPLKDSYGSDCTITIPEYGYHFDLSLLRQTTIQYRVRANEYEYILNVCSPIVDPPPNCVGSGACQTKPSDPSFAVDAGKSSSTLHYNNGAVKLVYESGKGNCHGKHNRSTVITFRCSHEKNNKVVFLSEEEDCTYHFNWPTSLVCVEQELQECSVISDTEHYDLSSLSLSNGNYFVPLQGAKNVIINICKKLSPSKNSQKCSKNSAACIIEYNRNNELKATNIGNVGAPFLENGTLKLSYTFGDSCEYSAAVEGTKNLQTVIEFECDKGNLNGEPRFIGMENCTYYFTWRHAAACPIKSETSLYDNCTAINPLTGFTYDLSPLRHERFYRVRNKHHEFNINVCTAVKNNISGAESGSCQQEIGSSRKWNLGNYNSRLHFHENVLILNYTDGDICHGLYHRNTIIQFTCGVGNGHPTFLFESDDCTYYFSWTTVYACEDRVHCVTTNGSEIIDLTPLTMDKGYHTAVDLTGNNDKYIINICSPLNDANALCRDSGACRIGTSIESLGRPHGPPFIDFLGHVTVIYSDGSPCNNKFNNTARIIFSCDHDAGMGEPSLIEKDESLCHYLFKWKTSLVCPEIKSVLPVNDCKFIDVNKGIDIDISPLKKRNSSYEVKGKRDDEKFTINICGPSEFGISDCSTAGVCFHGMADKENFGSVNSATFTYSGEEFTLTYDDGGTCPLSDSGKRSSRILFTCDETKGIGNPVLHKHSSCIATFRWKTSLVCVEKPPECTFRMNDNFYDLRLLSSMSHSWNISDSNGNIYWLNVCKETKVNFDSGNCRNSGVCMKHNNGTFISLGTLQSPTFSATDSGEITLRYGDGNKMCSGMAAVSNIKFICGKTMSIPRFVAGPSNSCEFDFIWETIAACAEIRKEVLPRNNNIIIDSRLQIAFNMSALFNRTFSLTWNGKNESYVYVINLSGVKLNTSSKNCENAAVCQTKPGKFYRDIGTVSTEKFYLKGNELLLELISYGRKCGKNKNKNVTTIINFVCSSAASVGIPSFYYESGNCDYLFDWETDLVCPKSIRENPSNDGISTDSVEKEHVKRSSESYVTQVVIAVILSAILVATILFIVSKEERRNAIRRKVNNAFLNIHLPKLCYRRANGETLLLSSAAATSCHDESDVEILS